MRSVNYIKKKRRIEEEEDEVEEDKVFTKPLKVVVTGSCNLKGIGFQLAKMLLEKNYEVIITNRFFKEGKTALNELKKISDKISVNSICFLDISEEYRIADFCKWIKKRHGGKIDVLVNNASRIVYGKRDIRENFETNFFGTRNLTDSLLPLLSNTGKIINVTCSISRIENMSLELQHGFLDWEEYSEVDKLIEQYYRLVEEDDWLKWRLWGKFEYYRAFSISKLALNGYTRYLSKRVPQTVFCCCPGWCKTDKGGKHSKRTPEDGAKVIFDLIQRNDRKVLNGQFFDRDGPVEYMIIEDDDDEEEELGD